MRGWRVTVVDDTGTLGAGDRFEVRFDPAYTEASFYIDNQFTVPAGSPYSVDVFNVLQDEMTIEGMPPINPVVGRIVYENNTIAKKVVKGNAIPQAGAWQRGDRIEFTDVVAGGNVGAVCVTSGTPGTWQEYGSVENA